MFSLELVVGILFGFLGFMAYDMLKHMLIRSVIIYIKCEDATLIMPQKGISLQDDSSDESSSLDDSNEEEDSERDRVIRNLLQGETVEIAVDSQTEEEEEEEEDIEDIIAKVRNKGKSKKTKTAKPEMGDFLQELKQLSDGLMKSITADGDNPIAKILGDYPKEMMEGNPHVQGVVKMLDSLSKGEGPTSEDMKQMQEGMTEMFSSLFNGELSTEEKETEQRDSEIVLHRLREIHNESPTDE